MASSLNKRILPFSNFLNESEESGKIKILILSGEKAKSKTAKSFEEECSNRGLECYVVNVNGVTIEKLYNGHLVRDSINEKEYIISPSDTSIIPRRGVIHSSHTKQIMREFENARYFCLNSLESIETCENKFLTSVILEEDELPVPRYALITDESYLDGALEKIGGEFPVVMKLLSGSQGIGVSIVDSYASLKSVYQTIKKLNPESEVLIQEKIDSNYDVRVQVLVKKFDPVKIEKDNCKILGSMKREAVSKDFRTNYSLGGNVSGYEITEEIIDLSCKAANSVGCHWCGVDIMIDSKTNKPYILEVNSSPGTEGISEAIGKPIVGDVIDFIEDKENWSYTKQEVGYLETIEIPEIGSLVAKFDTGNGSTSSTIHADSVEVRGDKVYWKIKDIELVSDLLGYTETEVGEHKIKRPIIELEVNLAGNRKKNVKVSPVDRTQKSTPFLANRSFMKEFGLMVNPHKAFVITDKPEGNYSPMKAKGQKHSGFKFNQKDG